MTLKKCTSCNGTGHDKPETAEERVRRVVSANPGSILLVNVGFEARMGVEMDDLRTIFAELDRVREAYEDALRSIGNQQETNAIYRAEVARLRAQRPVDIEALLAPVREVRDSVAKSMREHEGRVRSCVADESYDYAHAHLAQKEALVVVVKDMDAALAEAEKIGRGE